MSQQQPSKLNPQAQPFHPSQEFELRPQADSFYPFQQVVSSEQAQSQLSTEPQPFYPSEQVTDESYSYAPVSFAPETVQFGTPWSESTFFPFHPHYPTYPTPQETVCFATPVTESVPFSYQYPIYTSLQEHQLLFPSYYYPPLVQSHSPPWFSSETSQDYPPNRNCNLPDEPTRSSKQTESTKEWW
ncbi:hypothetical protein E0Z10_g4942 [Xylaria hypoxylon]|uniref:Uncharacterized protein n=1 Tax=Xylaria hypoxylon TaxID=37992 RepID=A0A4Z0YXB8_9PEZI|nr:hypothetical protein E0Z10_g4942 [Xylaria hypoxylon]